MELLNEESKEIPKNLWEPYGKEYQAYVTIPSIDSATDLGTDRKPIFMEDLETRKKVYGICGECNEPGTGFKWCQLCNAKRSKENFKNWSSGNENINKFIQDSQLNAIYYDKRLEWIPFEKFQNVTYIADGGFGKIYSAEWPEGCIISWDIENQEWERFSNRKVVLKSLNNSSNISKDFLNEVGSHIQIRTANVVPCYGITQDSNNAKDYMMVLRYYNHGDLRNYLHSKSIDYKSKIKNLYGVVNGLLDIHNAGKVHKDLHPGNVLFTVSQNNTVFTSISDLGMCQPADNKKSVKKEGVYGVLPYVAPEILRGFQYTEAADIYSFGIIMNEFMSEEMPHNDVSHDNILTVNICQGLRPKISDDTPKLVADLIKKCWDANPENRPTAKELVQIFGKWNKEKKNKNYDIYSQIKECEKIRENKLKSRLNENKSKSIEIHPQAIYTSSLLNFKNLPEPVNSLDLSSYFTT